MRTHKFEILEINNILNGYDYFISGEFDFSIDKDGDISLGYIKIEEIDELELSYFSQKFIDECYPTDEQLINLLTDDEKISDEEEAKEIALSEAYDRMEEKWAI